MAFLCPYIIAKIINYTLPLPGMERFYIMLLPFTDCHIISNKTIALLEIKR